MKKILGLFALLFVTPVMAYDGNETIGSLAELDQWCEKNSHFILGRRVEDGYGWYATAERDLDGFIVQGAWKEGDKEIPVACFIHSNAPRVRAVMTIKNKEVHVYSLKQRLKPIVGAGELRTWCRHSSAAQLLAQGYRPFNWTVSHWNSGNYIFVEGEWRVSGDSKTVVCSVIHLDQGGQPQLEWK